METGLLAFKRKKQMFNAIDVETQINKRDSETFGIYVGCQEISNVLGPTKVGRTVNVKAIQRGRAQGGANWWFYAWWSVNDRQETYSLEKQAKKALKEYSVKGLQGQKELYSLSLAETVAILEKVLGKPTLLCNTD